MGNWAQRRKDGKEEMDRKTEEDRQVTAKADTLDRGLLEYLDELDGQKRVLLNQESHKTF